jgi:hypothetical protein
MHVPNDPDVPRPALTVADGPGQASERAFVEQVMENPRERPYSDHHTPPHRTPPAVGQIVALRIEA